MSREIIRPAPRGLYWKNKQREVGGEQKKSCHSRRSWVPFNLLEKSREGVYWDNLFEPQVPTFSPFNILVLVESTLCYFY